MPISRIPDRLSVQHCQSPDAPLIGSPFSIADRLTRLLYQFPIIGLHLIGAIIDLYGEGYMFFAHMAKVEREFEIVLAMVNTTFSK